MLDLEFTPSITKEYLLSKNNEETYMSYYLGIPVDKKLHLNPLRSDNKVTCAFFKGKSGTLYFKDFATGDCLSFINVVMTKYNCSYHKALYIIAQDFGYVNNNYSKPKVVIKSQPKFESTKQAFIQCELKEFSEPELKWWGKYGITKDILNKFCIYSCKSVFLNGTIHSQSSQHSPIYGYYFGKKEGIEQWKIYYPNKKEFRFIGNTSSKNIQGYRQLPKKGKLLVITKSMKDVAALYAYKIPAIAPNSENLFVTDKLLEELKSRFDRILVLYDQDRAGKYNMAKIRKQHPELDYFVIPKKYNAKDFSDLRKLYGRDKTLDLIKEFILKWKR